MKKKLALIALVVLAIIVATFTGCNATDTENKVSTISMFTAFDKTTYIQGEELDLSGAQIQIVYEDDTYEIISVTSEMISSFNSSILGEQLLRISYQGVGCSVPIKVVKSAIDNIEVITTKEQVYIVEQNLDYTGITLRVNYTNGLQESYSVTADMCSDFDMSLAGEQTVHVVLPVDGVNYDVYYDISVRDKKLIGLEVATTPSKQIYYVGDSVLDLTDGVLFLQYDNGYPQRVNMTDLKGLASSWDSTKVTDNGVVKLTYGGLEANYYVQIKVKDVLEIEELSLPEGDQLLNTDLDLTGLSLKLTYNNYQTEVITFPTNFVYVEGYDKTKVGYQTLTIHFMAGTTTMATTYNIKVYVNDKVLSDIEINRSGAVIYQDTKIDISDWTYVLVYNNGERSAAEPLADNMIVRQSHEDVYNYSTSGEKTWNIQYRTFSTTYTFNVEALSVVSAEVTCAQPVTVYLGHEFDTTNIRLKVKYNNGVTKEDVKVSSKMIADFDKDALGVQYVTINYADAYTACFPISLQAVVVKKVVTSLGIYQDIIKKSYTFTESIDFTGLQIALTFEGDTEPTIITAFDEDWTFQNDEWSADKKFSTKGDKNIWVTYAGLDNPETQGVMLTVSVRNALLDFGLLTGNLGTVVEGMEINYAKNIFQLTYEDGAYEVVYDKDNEKFVMVTDSGAYGMNEDSEVVILDRTKIKDILGTLTIDFDSRNLTIESRAVDVYYAEGNEELSLCTTVDVVTKSPVAIEVYKLPNQLEYVYQGSANIELDGIIVNLVYDNGTRKVLGDDEFDCPNVDTEILDEEGQEISVSYHAIPTIRTSFKVYVKESIPVAIEWLYGIPSVAMQEGVDFNIGKAAYPGSSGFLVNAHVRITMSDGKKNDYAVSDILNDLSINIYSKYSVGSQTAELLYKNSPDMVLKVNVIVSERELTGIQFVSDSDLEVIEMADLDLSLCSLKLLYDHGMTSDTIPMQQSYIIKSEENEYGYDKTNTTNGKREVAIVYGGLTTYTNVYVTKKEIVSISMNRLPKVKYIEGEFMDSEALEGGSIVIYYNNGTTLEKYLTDASVNMPQNSFNINMVRFDNTEFSGQSKLQTIFVTYKDELGKTYETDFDIIMRDRKYLEVDYDTTNVYSFTYGDLNETNAPTLSVKGYYSFDSNERLYNFDMSKIVVEYIRYEERNDPRDPNKDYTVLPSDAGQYIICVSYNSTLYGDMIHNSLNDTSKIITIFKKNIYIAVDDISKTYGTENPVYTIKAYGVDATGGMSLTAEPFATGDSFTSIGFCTATPTQYESVAYYSSTEYTNIFDIGITSLSGVKESNISEGTSVGQYIITIGGLTSENYNINYVNGTFTINKRYVKVVPDNMEMTYGTLATEIRYDALAIDGVANSGLYGQDKLGGAPIRISGKDAGVYAITIGTLSNANYEIIFDNTKTVTINPRDIYIKVENSSKIYGEELPEFVVSYFRNEACTDTNAFAYEADVPAGLGKLSFEYGDVDRLTDIGIYTISVLITPYATHEIPTGVTDINKNYTIHYISGFLEIDKRPVTVIADNKSKAFDDADPELTYSVNYSAGGDGIGLVAINLKLEQYESLVGALARTTGENVGRYVINIGTLEAENPNYDIIFTQGVMSILAREIIVKIDEGNLTKVYDGRVPTITEYDMYKVDGDTEVYFGNQDDVYEDYITISILGSSRNVGSYSIDLETLDTNISVAFPDDVDYRYVITPLVVDAVEYVNLPTEGANEYKKAAYVISAKIPADKLQKEYNYDGTEKTNDDNEPLVDEVEVILSRYSATEVGTYTTSAIRLGNSNYELADTAKEAVQFTIVPRSLVIEVYPTDKVNNTLEKEYNGQGATLNIKEYTVTNTIPGDTLQVVPYVSNPNSTTGSSPKDVYYDADGNIAAYEIKVDQPAGNNYTVSFKDTYYYKITPKDVTITIFSAFLSKTYDGNEPSINSSNYSVSIATLMTSTISFVFTREGNDGRSNADVGTYAISVSCTDKNHTVKLSEEFVYTIEQASVTVTVKATADSKSYDGKPITYKDSDISMSSIPGITPRIRTFANTTDYQNAKDALEEMTTVYSSLLKSTTSINFTDMAYAKVLRDTAYSDYLSARTLFNSYGSLYFSAGNYLSVGNYISNLGGADGTAGIFAELNGYIEAGEKSSAVNALARASAMVKQAYDAVYKENHYLAFIMSGSDSAATNVGTYTYELRFNDPNKEYNLQNVTRRYEITRQNVVLKITGLNENGAECTYGDIYSAEDVANWEQNILGYEFYGDISFTNKLEGILIEGSLTITGIADAKYASTEGGRGYSITPSSSIIMNSNYLVTYNTVFFDVAKKELTIVGDKNIGALDDVNGAFYYGEAINSFRLRQWTLKQGGAELVGTDTISVIDTTVAKFECSMAVQPTAGQYALKISGFVADNYSFVYEDGLVTINKAPLTVLKNNVGNLTRLYGDPVELEYTGFMYSDTMATLGTFVAPTPTDSSAAGFLLTTPAGTTAYEISFYIQPAYVEQFTNYYIVLDDSYSVIVERAPLYLVFTGENGADYLEAEYGQEPIYSLDFEGFKNGETASSLGVDISSCVEFDLTRSVAASGELFGDTVEFKNEVDAKLSNYEYSVRLVTYIVNPKKLYVTLDKDISVMYEYNSETSTGSASVSMYVMKTTSGESDAKIVSGQYSGSNIKITGFIDGEDADSVLNFTNTTISSDDTNTYEYIDSAVVHSLSYNQYYIGTQDLRLANLGFKESVPNYEPVYLAVKLTIYSKVTSLTVDDETVVLEGDDYSDITFNTLSEALSIETYSLTDTSANITYSGLSNTSYNTNQDVTITFNRTYNLTDYDGPTSREIDNDGETIEQNIVSALTTTVTNGQITGNVRFRIYNKASKELDNSLASGETTYVTGSALVSTASESQTITSVDFQNSDAVDMTIKATKTKNKSSVNGSIMIMLEGCGSEGDYNVPVETGTDPDTGLSTYSDEEHHITGYNIKFYASVNDTENRLYYLAFCGATASSDGQQFFDGTVINSSVTLSFGGVNLFDGCAHDLKFYHDKRLGEIYISLDGTMATVITGVDDNYNSIDYSTLSFTVMGDVSASVSGVKRYIQGYNDRYATLVRAANNGSSSNTVTYMSTSYFNTVHKSVATMLTPTALKDTSYTKEYFVNGTKIAITNNEGTLLTGSLYYDFAPGSYRVEMVVLDGSGNLISSGYVVAIFTVANSAVSYNGKTVLPTAPVAVSYLTQETDSSIITESVSQTIVNAGYENEIVAKADNTTITRKVVTISKTNDGISQFRSVELSLGYEPARIINNGAVDIRSTSVVNYIMLYGNASTFASSSPYAPTASQSISIRIQRDRTGTNTASYTTALVLTYNSTRYALQLDNIQWDDGSIYTVGLYMDYLATTSVDWDGNQYIWGNKGFAVIISKNGEFLSQTYVTASTAFENDKTGASVSLSETYLNNILKASNGVSAIYGTDCRFTLHNAVYNGGNAIRYNYFTSSEDFYSADTHNGNLFNVGTSVTLSSAYGHTALYSIYNALSLRFKSQTAVSSGEQTFTWYLATKYDTVLNSSGGENPYGLYLTYDAGSKELYFSFYSGSTHYAKQVISQGVNLTDGTEHIINVKLNRTPTVLSGGVQNGTQNIIESTNTPKVVASTATITVDGSQSRTAYYPYYNTTNNWVMRTNAHVSGSMITSNGNNFVSLFNYTSFAVGQGTAIMLYGYDIGFNEAGAGIETEYGVADI